MTLAVGKASRKNERLQRMRLQRDQTRSALRGDRHIAPRVVVRIKTFSVTHGGWGGGDTNISFCCAVVACGSLCSSLCVTLYVYHSVAHCILVSLGVSMCVSVCLSISMCMRISECQCASVSVALHQ
jgi:hypothetical protein